MLTLLNSQICYVIQTKGTLTCLFRIINMFVMVSLSSESWEVASKNSAKPEGNPFLAFLRAFVAAVVKFWSE